MNLTLCQIPDLLPPRIVARRAQSHAALASNCLMLAVRVAKTAAVIAAGFRLLTDDSAAPPSPRLAPCTFGCGGAALGKIAREIGEEAARQVRGFPSELRRQVGSGWGRGVRPADFRQSKEPSPLQIGAH